MEAYQRCSAGWAFIAWRNLRLINRIATLYGIELGYFSRIRLFRLVLLNIAFAGASELVREVGMDWMSQDIAASHGSGRQSSIALIPRRANSFWFS